MPFNVPTIIMGIPVLAAIAPVTGKPIHYEEVKSELIKARIRCVDCHISRDDTSLTAYGVVISNLGSDVPMLERVKETETSLSETAPEAVRSRAAGRIDVDGDGIPNWVEILAGSSPSETSDRGKLHDRIERVVSCQMCHTSTSGGGGERAPHNGFGKALSEMTAKRKKGRNALANQPILPRLKQRRRFDNDKDRIKDWDEVLLFYHPADAEDKPTANAVKAYKREQRTRRKADEGFGKIHGGNDSKRRR